MITVFLSSDML